MNTSMRKIPIPKPQSSTKPNPNPRTGVRRLLSAFLALSAASAAALTVPGTAVAQDPSAATATPLLTWVPCKATPPFPEPTSKAQCATVEVPVDWSKPKGPKMGIAVARHRATAPGQRIGVLVTNPGGPGTPGVDAAMYADDPALGSYSPNLLKHFDIIGFDPRGVGASRSADCDETILESIPTRPRDAAEFDRMRTLNGRLAASCLARMGPLASNMDTESVARDMDAIRVALGERKISFLGHSYGTSVGERYARMFPGNLRALALDSAMDPDRPDAERYLREGSVTVDNSLKRLAAWCAKDTSCALKGQDLMAVIKNLFARADAGTLREPGPDGPTRNKVDADQLTNFLSFDIRNWNPETTAGRLAALHTGKGEVYLDNLSGDLYGRLVLCRDESLRIRDYAEYRAIRERVTKAAPIVRYNSQTLDYILACQGWPMPTKPRPAQAPGALPPVLVVNATHDMATPLPGARRMARAFPKATLLTLDVVGHWLYGDGRQAKQAIDDYLVGRKR
ncbi:alpha/beta hydrolase [Streptomyces albipurpureus]|uniref:Alpha/beta hydrolase n=1 Tax=Streptomyces albipurpureus TaxID=2897419 RepID=A0ABT0UJQ4_9ACTN|nr:alpha/beta hydrolase [Streptomyces sp. CWNU-1]MCM2388239.1 alpha/beta hydrolase [Streptomyces sp. CWNU-1]